MRGLAPRHASEVSGASRLGRLGASANPGAGKRAEHRGPRPPPGAPGAVWGVSHFGEKVIVIVEERADAARRVVAHRL